MKDFLPCRVCKYPTPEGMLLQVSDPPSGIHRVLHVACAWCGHNLATALTHGEERQSEVVNEIALDLWNRENQA